MIAKDYNIMYHYSNSCIIGENLQNGTKKEKNSNFRYR